MFLFSYKCFFFYAMFILVFEYYFSILPSSSLPFFIHSNRPPFLLPSLPFCISFFFLLIFAPPWFTCFHPSSSFSFSYFSSFPSQFRSSNRYCWRPRYFFFTNPLMSQPSLEKAVMHDGVTERCAPPLPVCDAVRVCVREGMGDEEREWKGVTTVCLEKI